MIIIGTSMPQETKLAVSEQVNSQIEKSHDAFGHILPQYLSKMGHFVFFAVFAGIAVLIMNEPSFFRVMPILLMFAGGTELSQFFIDGRGPLFSDFLIDMAGSVFGLVLVQFIYKSKFFIVK